MQTILFPGRSEWRALSMRPMASTSEIEQRVAPILEAVKARGDAALREFTEQFDGVALTTLQVGRAEIDAAAGQLSAELKAAIETAGQNIRKFHEAQASQAEPVTTTEGVTCWRKALPIQSVGLYIPGGTAPLFSSVLMLGIPAAIAQCRQVVLCTPPDRNGAIHPAILYAAKYCGIERIYRVGGAQAIAAMAYGTESVPAADKLFGPGNQYVTAAKQMVTRMGTAIDMPAGPSEVVVIADDQASPEFVASDLLAQAEHGIDSQAILLTDSESLAAAVADAVRRQLSDLPRRDIAAQSISNSKIIVFASLEEAMAFSNGYAPEHLIISTNNYIELAEAVTCAGSVFLGAWTPESLGDYASGTNHTLPTNGFARAFSGVSLDSFMNRVTFQEASEKGLRNIGPTVETLAAAEMLQGHKNAVSIRLKALHEYR